MAARVKAVLSGDTLVLVDKAGKEQQLSLAYVSAPRLTQTSGEAGGFEAREFLRTLAIGKPVNFRIIYEINGRPYGNVSSPIFSSLVEYTLNAGWVALRDNAPTNPGFADVSASLEAAEAAARSAQRGIWAHPKPRTIRILGDVPDSLFGSGRTVPSIVEKVVAGDRIAVRAMFTGEEHYVGPAAFGGIRCARSGAGDAFGDAAAAFVAARLLHRSQTRTVFHAPAPSNPAIPLVTLTHPAGDIALLLVTQGLASVNESHVAVGSERLLQLRAAQREAEAAGRNMWQAAAAAKVQRQAELGDKGFNSVVVKVVSSDTFVLATGAVVQLSSVRAPRRGDDAELANEAREFARRLLIGKEVAISVDGESTTARGEHRLLVTMSYGPALAKNAALAVIAAGWATTTRHRRDDLDRSPFYDELLAAEEVATAAHEGVHALASTKKKASAAIVDASESVVRARAYQAALERRGRIPAVIDLVISGGRYRLAVPSENCTLTAVLDGVRLPRAGEPFADEALAYVTREWNQRDVQLRVRGVDKTGAFSAVITMGGRSVAADLLREGLASVHEGAANAANLRQEFDDAQEAAQAAQKGMWADYVAPVEPAGESNSASSAAAVTGASGADGPVAVPPARAYQDAVITSVARDSVFYRLAQDNVAHARLVGELKEFLGGPTNADKRVFARRPKRGDSVVTSTFERGTIMAFDRATNQFEVLLVDVGTRTNVLQAGIFPLPAKFGQAKAPALAKRAELRFVHAPVSFFEKAYLEYLRAIVGQAVVVYGGDIFYTADSKSATDSLNWRLVSGAYAAVPVTQASEEGAGPFLEAQEEARAARRGMWQYGDPREDDDL